MNSISCTPIDRNDYDEIIYKKSKMCEYIAFNILRDTQLLIDDWFNRRRNGLIGIYDIIQGSAYAIQDGYPYADVAESDRHVRVGFVSKWILERLLVTTDDSFFYYDEIIDPNGVVAGWNLPFLDSQDYNRFMYSVTNIIDGAIEIENRRLRGTQKYIL